VGAALHVIDAGAGPTLVLVHGAMERAGGLARVARHLRNVHLVRYDRRGYAGSVALGPGDLDAHAADLVGLLGDLGNGPTGERPTVVGHSMGGLVALAAAHAAPDLIASVGAYEPPTPWHPRWPVGIESWTGDEARAVDLVVEHAIGAERWARAPASVRAVRRAEGGALMTEMRSLVTHPPGGVPPALGPVDVPLSIAYGSASPPNVGDGLVDLVHRLGSGTIVRIEGPAHRAPTTHARAYAAWAASLVRPDPDRVASPVPR